MQRQKQTFSLIMALAIWVFIGIILILNFQPWKDVANMLVAGVDVLPFQNVFSGLWTFGDTFQWVMGKLHSTITLLAAAVLAVTVVWTLIKKNKASLQDKVKIAALLALIAAPKSMFMFVVANLIHLVAFALMALCQFLQVLGAASVSKPVQRVLEKLTGTNFGCDNPSRAGTYKAFATVAYFLELITGVTKYNLYGNSDNPVANWSLLLSDFGQWDKDLVNWVNIPIILGISFAMEGLFVFVCYLLEGMENGGGSGGGGSRQRSRARRGKPYAVPDVDPFEGGMPGGMPEGPFPMPGPPM